MELVTTLTTTLAASRLNASFSLVAALPLSLILVAACSWWIFRRK